MTQVFIPTCAELTSSLFRPPGKVSGSSRQQELTAVNPLSSRGDEGFDSFALHVQIDNHTRLHHVHLGNAFRKFKKTVHWITNHLTIQTTATSQNKSTV